METGLQITFTKIPYKFNVRSVRKKTIFIIVLILLCCLILTFISSGMKYYGNIVELDMLGYINHYYDRLENIDGVTIKTELDVYHVDTAGILVEWDNNTDIEITDIWSWNLFKKQDEEFVPVVRDSNSENHSSYMHFSLEPGEKGKRIYWLETCTDNLTPGIYQIKTSFYSLENKNPFTDGYDIYNVETEFEVSDDKSKCGKSALSFLNGGGKYDDITQGTWSYNSGVYEYLNPVFSLYQNGETYDTVLTDWTYEYEIGEGVGKYGVGSNFQYEADGKTYLIYSYSREENGGQVSYICALDITDNSNIKEVYKSEPYFDDYYITVSNNFSNNNNIDGLKYGWYDKNGDLVIHESQGFQVYLYEYVYNEEYGYSETKFIAIIGRLFYEDGVFFFEEGK